MSAQYKLGSTEAKLIVQHCQNQIVSNEVNNMLLSVLLLLVVSFSVVSAGLTPDPSSDPLCPLEEPMMGDSCSELPDLADCLYQEFAWPKNENIVYMLQRCTCINQEFLCSPLSTDSPLGTPLSHPNNDLSCPDLEPTSGEICTDDSDCIYRTGNVVTGCGCFDGIFSCLLLAPTPPDAFPDNDAVCPATSPNDGDSCSIGTDPTFKCLYKSFSCPASFNVEYLRECSCSDNAFVCTEKTIDCVPQCPIGTPPGPDNVCLLGQKCRYDPVWGSCREKIEFQTNCECNDQRDGSLAFDCDFTPLEECPFEPDCPAEPPLRNEKCIPEAVAAAGCNYDPFGCPGATGDGFYLVTCNCNTVVNEFVCEQVLPLCFTEKPAVPVPCFAGDTTVEVMLSENDERTTMFMKELQIGDKVHVGKNKYEAVYSFGHYNPVAKASFLKVQTTNATPLLVSEDHMVYVQYRGFIPASDLRQGDRMVDGSTGDEVTVKLIRTVEAQGVFAPFTPSGKIVVNGILASSFVSLESKPNLTIMGVTLFTHQWIAHTFEFPHRLVCHYWKTCPNESYTSDGISTWVAIPLQIFQWVLVQNTLIRSTFLSVSLVAVIFFSLLEPFILLQAPILLILFCVLFMIARRVQLSCWGFQQLCKSKNL